MPVDEDGKHADLILDAVSVFNRINSGQWYEQAILSAAEGVGDVVRNMFATAPKNKQPWQEAYNLIIKFTHLTNPKWSELLQELHPTPVKQQELVSEVINGSPIYIQITPFQDGVGLDLIRDLKKHWNLHKSRVTFTVPTADGTEKVVTTKQPILIGHEYWYCLYKIPHMHCANLTYVNQYHCPVRANSLAKATTPLSNTPIRIGEDECRNLNMVAGPEAATHITGAYANSVPAVQQLARHLLFDQKPSQLESIEMTSDEIIKSNSIGNVVKHTFSCMGVNITPDTRKMDKDIFDGLDLPEE